MKKHKVILDERLDSIVYEHYKTLDARVMSVVLDANEELLDKDFADIMNLEVGSTLFLPKITFEQESSTLKALWK